MIEDRSVQDSLGACPECGADCVDSPSGVVCLNGHGGAEPVAPKGHSERCPGCGASQADGVQDIEYECGSYPWPGGFHRSKEWIVREVRTK